MGHPQAEVEDLKKREKGKIRERRGRKGKKGREGKKGKGKQNLTGRAMHGMCMNTHLVGTHDRVHTRESSATTALHAPESHDAAGGAQGHGAEFGDLHDCTVVENVVENVGACISDLKK